MALTCGLSVGDAGAGRTEEKRLLFLYRVSAKAASSGICVYQWAHSNHLTLVTINAINDAPPAGPKS